jgi:phytoene synthase
MAERHRSTWSKGWSYAYCEALTRRSASTFYPAFYLLPREQRQGMFSLYAFSRITDDLADGPDPPHAKRGPLERWRTDLLAALASCGDRHPIHPALRHTVERFRIPPGYLEEVIDGVSMDLNQSVYPTFADLYRYCYRVASAVGLSCIRIWGCREPSAHAPAEAAGIALQLTNILRDIPEDAARGRIYLPLEDLDRFRYSPDDLVRGVLDDRFRALVRFQAERALGYYAAAGPLAGLLPPPGRAVFLLMLRTYRALLEEMIRRDFDVFSRRARVHPLRKLWLAARSLPVRWGLLDG